MNSTPVSRLIVMSSSPNAPSLAAGIAVYRIKHVGEPIGR